MDPEMLRIQVIKARHRVGEAREILEGMSSSSPSKTALRLLASAVSDLVEAVDGVVHKVEPTDSAIVRQVDSRTEAERSADQARRAQERRDRERPAATRDEGAVAERLGRVLGGT